MARARIFFLFSFIIYFCYHAVLFALEEHELAALDGEPRVAGLGRPVTGEPREQAEERVRKRRLVAAACELPRVPAGFLKHIGGEGAGCQKKKEEKEKRPRASRPTPLLGKAFAAAASQRPHRALDAVQRRVQRQRRERRRLRLGVETEAAARESAAAARVAVAVSALLAGLQEEPELHEQVLHRVHVHLGPNRAQEFIKENMHTYFFLAKQVYLLFFNVG